MFGNIHFTFSIVLFGFGLILAPSSNTAFYLTTQVTADTSYVKSSFAEIDDLIDRGNFELAHSKIDSLESLSQDINYDHGLAYSEIKRVDILLIQKQIDSAFVKINDVIDRFPDSRLRLNFYSLQATAYNYKGLSSLAIESYKKGLNYIDLLAEDKRDRALAATYVNMASAYHKLGDKSNTIKNYLDGLKFAEATKDSSFLTITLNNLGDSFNSYNDYERAEYYLKRAESIAIKKGYKPDLLRIYLNLGNTFSNSENYDDGLEYYDKALILHNEIRPNTPPFQIIYNLGVLYSNTKEFFKAKEAFQESLKYCEELNIPQGLYFNYSGLGDLYDNFSQPYEAINWYKKALEVATNLNQSLYIVQLHEKLYLSYKDAGETSLALDALENFKALSDSLTKMDADNAVSELESQLELSRQTDLNTILNEKQIEQERLLELRFWFNIALIALIIIILLFFFFVLKTGRDGKKINQTLNQQKKELEDLNATKDKLFAIVAHDLRSPMSSLQGMLYLLNENNEKDVDVKELTASIEPVLQRNIDTLDDLLIWAKLQMSGINLKTALVDTTLIIDDVISKQSFESEDKKIEVLNNVPAPTLAYIDTNGFKLIMRNLLSNSIKFSNKGGKIIFDCVEKGDFVIFSVNDNGIGIPKELHDNLLKGNTESREGTNMETGTGFGLSICKEFAERMNGTIYFESKENMGTTFFIELPKKKL